MTRCTLLLLALAMTGCTSAQERFATLQPQARAKLRTVEAISSKVEALPSLPADQVTYDGLPLEVMAPLKPGNAWVLERELLAQLASPAETKPQWRSINSTDQWSSAAELARSGEPLRSGWKASDVERSLAPLLTLRVLIVLRVERSSPSVDAEKHQLDPGAISGEARLFSVDDGKDLGGFRFAGERSTYVSYRFDGDDSEQARAQAAAESQLEAYGREAVERGVRKFVRGTPVDWKY